MRLLAFLIAFLFTATLPTPSYAEEKGAEPLMVLIETNPWLMVIGSDSPRFSLYKNGEVIYRTEKGYRSFHLDGVQFDALVASMDMAGVARHQGTFETSDASDQPEEIFLGFDQAKPWALRVYGRIGSEKEAGTDAVPAEVASLYRLIEGFDRADATEWLPPHIEIMIWPYDYAPDASIHWPSDWPGLDDPATRQRGDGYSLFLPSSRRDALTAFLETRREKGAVEIDGKKWAVSYRYPFPGEERWMGGGD